MLWVAKPNYFHCTMSTRFYSCIYGHYVKLLSIKKYINQGKKFQVYVKQQVDWGQISWLKVLCIPVAMPSNRERTRIGFLFSAATGGYSLAGSWWVNDGRKNALFDRRQPPLARTGAALAWAECTLQPPGGSQARGRYSRVALLWL